jgi:LysR family transcriptional regulator, hydrogen peroxide-inducible genes activator
MEFIQLEMFVAVVEESTFRDAAVRVLRTQPAVSMAIHKLEEEIGMHLLLRGNHPRLHGNQARQLTEAGEKLYRYARTLLDLRRQVLSDLSEVRYRSTQKEKVPL